MEVWDVTTVIGLPTGREEFKGEEGLIQEAIPVSMERVDGKDMRRIDDCWRDEVIVGCGSELLDD